MKVFVALLLTIGSVAARGSGPYLPSGWRPEGPAFYLPSEVAKPVARTAQEVVVEETEASGSDALREYGPPKLEVSIDVNQGLPDVATEQTFFRAIKEEVVDSGQEANVEVNPEQVAAVTEKVSTVTESQTAEAVKATLEEVAALSEVDATAGSPSTDVIESFDAIQTKALTKPEVSVVPRIVIPEDVVVPTDAVEVVVPLYQQELVQDVLPTPVSETVASARLEEQELVSEAIPTQSSDSEASVTLLQQEVVPTATQEVAVEKVAEEVNNIADAINFLNKEIKAVEIQAEVNSGVTSAQVISGSLEQAPEGFLEYGPPGFLEYGPPKQGILRGLTTEVGSSGASENNEVRRRRFSPKFRSTKKH
ncbi:unnamed protein product [Arctia plantaginis]|uniref:Uncharacterized protein n=1 Tax=Arctia plantaginis TaxID=874455 RepID=A0A8S1AIW8_ARCPL|nr:unnamed protein product [Arctia plantaginis]